MPLPLSEDETCRSGSGPNTIEYKKEKINSNYETIKVLKDRLDIHNARKRVGMTRAAYIKMIFDVTKKVEIQHGELDKTVQETRRLQKDVGKLGGRLDRSFAQVEETILKVSSA